MMSGDAHLIFICAYHMQHKNPINLGMITKEIIWFER